MYVCIHICMYVCMYYAQMKVWDMRQPQAVVSIPMNERVYCMDAKGQAVVGNNNNHGYR